MQVKTRVALSVKDVLLLNHKTQGEKMLSIGSGQWQELQVQRNEQLKSVIADEMLERYPDTKISRNELIEQLSPVIETGQGLGIKSGELLFQHVLLSKALGVDYFTVIPFIEQVLSSDQLDEPFKLLWLNKWAEAVEKSLKLA